MMTSISLAFFKLNSPCRLCTAFDSVFLCLRYWKLNVSFILLGYKNVFAGTAFISIISKLKATGIFWITIIGQFILVQCTSIWVQCYKRLRHLSVWLVNKLQISCISVANLCSFNCDVRMFLNYSLTANMFRLLTCITGLVMCLA